MNYNNPHRPLRSSWKSEVFAKPKKQGVIVKNFSLGGRGTTIVKVRGQYVHNVSTNNPY